MSEAVDFDLFYRSVHGGRAPFPWQSRLARQVLGEGWPAAVGVPTGLGKTACIDIAVWVLAVEATRPPRERRAATRVWYVVNRRLLVDAAYEHGRRLQQLLQDPTTLPGLWPEAEPAHVHALRWVGERLRSLTALGSEQGPLHVARIRGGAEIDARPPDPSQPALLFATVPMYASRWLFQGYGVSANMRPVEAALAGTDSLVLLDESHLARPLRDLMSPAAEVDVGDPRRVLPGPRSRPQLVELSATGDPGESPFLLDGDDEAHPVIQTRLRASKPTSLIEATKKTLARTMADQALQMLDGDPLAIVVFCNTARLAREVHSRLVGARGRGSFDALLLTGRVRDRDGDAIRSRLTGPDGVAAGRPDGRPARHLIVVATQTLEVGADLDFDRLVTETAGTRALVQRFGRLNRLGARNHRAQAVICHPADEKEWAVYGREPALVWDRLRRLEGALDLGPGGINQVLGEPQDAPIRVAELLPVHLWEWAKTSCPPPGMAPIEPFIDGLGEEHGVVSVVWRAFLPTQPALAGVVDGQEERQVFPRLRSSEIVDVPVGELRSALAGASISTVLKVSDGATLTDAAVEQLRPGDQIVLPAGLGLYDEFGWNPAATGAVLDLSPLESRTLVLHPDVLRNLLDEVPEAVHVAIESSLEPDGDGIVPDRVPSAAIIEALGSAKPRPEIGDTAWSELLNGLADHVETNLAGLPPHIPAVPNRGRVAAQVAADAFDELSFQAASVALEDHLEVVGDAAGRILAALGADERLVEVARCAGRYHDLGKADPRFQRWLSPDGPVQGLLAKSDTPAARRTAARIAAGWPHRGRHELLSARLLEACIKERGPLAADDDLLLHLVISHHGHGRPTVPVVVDDSYGIVSAQVQGDAISVSGDLSQHDWEQPSRFRRLCERYGYWGLALLEAAVRQADHAASARVGTDAPRVLEVV